MDELDERLAAFAEAEATVREREIELAGLRFSMDMAAIDCVRAMKLAGRETVGIGDRVYSVAIVGGRFALKAEDLCGGRPEHFV